MIAWRRPPSSARASPTAAAAVDSSPAMAAMHARPARAAGTNMTHRDAAPAVGRPAERADGGRGVAPGGGEAGLGQRADEFHQPDGAASSRGPAQSDLGFGRVELAQGGEQLRPAAGA